LTGHYAVAGALGLAVTQGSWSQKGEPIRLCVMGGAMALLAAAVLLLVRRPWSWWATLVSLAAALGAFGVATVGFVWAGDPNRWDANAAYVAPIAAGFLILVWLFAVFAALCGLAALAGLFVLLLPATRRDFWLRHGEATGQASRTSRCT
jgi:peptidoglycan/LPS O-acetylase OafA/YrhL